MRTFQPLQPWVSSAFMPHNSPPQQTWQPLGEYHLPNGQDDRTGPWYRDDKAPQKGGDRVERGLSSRIGQWKSHMAPTPPQEVAPPKINGPFLAGLDVGPWGPPPAQLWKGQQAQLTVEEQLALARDKIRQLTVDNKQLRETLYNSTTSMDPMHQPTVLPPRAPTPRTVIPPIGTAFQPLGRMEDEHPQVNLNPMVMNIPGDEMVDKAKYSAPQFVTMHVLQGTFNFATMSSNLIRAIVWILGHVQPKNNHESAALKTAVKALTARFGLADSSDPQALLTRSIIEWAQPLCYTSCGNYLCQQLLERGETKDKLAFLGEIQDEIVPIASNKFGTHVLCKAINMKELEEPVAAALFKFGVYQSMQTGARRLWRMYLEKCRQARNLGVFDKVNGEMAGHWADLACVNENGSISVQQVFEVFASKEVMEPCFREITGKIASVANNQFGHFVIAKLLSNTEFKQQTCDAIINAYPPVATTHHGVNLAKMALTEGGRAHFAMYVEAICRQDEGHIPALVTIATSSIGKAHLIFLLTCLTQTEQSRMRTTCRNYCTTLRNCQSGNDLLRHLGIMHTTGAKRTSIIPTAPR
ncbi:hypothetical protein IAT38_008137 [Cryptococcus sp. DSM 104549]